MKKHIFLIILLSFMSSSSFGNEALFKKSKCRKTKKTEIVCKDPKKGDCCKKKVVSEKNTSNNVLVSN